MMERVRAGRTPMNEPKLMVESSTAMRPIMDRSGPAAFPIVSFTEKGAAR